MKFRALELDDKAKKIGSKLVMKAVSSDHEG